MKPINSPHLTAMHRTELSAPVLFLHQNNLLKGTILDYGAGRGSDADFLAGKYHYTDVDRYDPFYFPTQPTRKYDTVLCTYVLNVITSTEAEKVLNVIVSLMEDNASAFITVRCRLTRFGFRPYRGGFVYYREVKLQLPVVHYNHDKRFIIYKLTK